VTETSLADVETFSTVIIRAVVNEDADDDDRELAGETFAIWTDLESPEDSFAPYEIRGLVRTSDDYITWLPDDTVVELIAGPSLAGHPASLAEGADRVRVSDPDLSSSWHPLIGESEAVMGPVSNTVDPESGTETLLYALSVAPEVPELRKVLLSALAARYAQVVRDPRTYPPAGYPWAG
jgi:hypothetical protein